VTIAVTACAPGSPVIGGRGSQSAPRSDPKAIAIGINEDVTSFWDVVTSGGGTGARELANVVSQHLVAIAADGSPTPRLLAEIPSLERGTWTVQPDGSMETIWKLRTNAFWHDGTPFTADDVLFSFAVNRDPEIPNANQETVRLISRMEVIDSATVRVAWSEPYPYADRLEHRDLYPLPRHLLEDNYVDGTEGFLLQPYFSDEFVGLGPYQVTRWERGSHLDLTAFDPFFLGRPRIDTIRVQFITDFNTMLANLSSRAIHMMLTLGAIPNFAALMTLKREWESSRHGTVLTDPILYRFIEPQKRSFAMPSDLADPRVRRALMHLLDREEVTRVNFGDDGIVADSWAHPHFPQYSRLQEAMVRYPTDPRRAQALLEEAGWQRGSKRLEKAGQSFNLTIRDHEGEQDAMILAAAWKPAGVHGTYEPRSAALFRDREDRATFTGVELTSSPLPLLSASRKLASGNIPTAENRWTGSNRGGYSNPTWDDLDRRANTTLGGRERVEIERDLARIFTSELPLLPLYFGLDAVPVGGGITGPVANTGAPHRGFILHTWNIADWDVPARG
jgi:peptide/nickel transport system substrate-binding protein